MVTAPRQSLRASPSVITSGRSGCTPTARSERRWATIGSGSWSCRSGTSACDRTRAGTVASATFCRCERADLATRKLLVGRT